MNFYHFLKVHKILHGCSRTDADWTSGGPFGDSFWLDKMLGTDGMCSYFCLLLTSFSLVKFTNTNQRNWFSHSSNFCQPQRSLLLANLRLKWRLCFSQTIEVCMFLQACYRITNPWRMQWPYYLKSCFWKNSFHIIYNSYSYIRYIYIYLK